MKTIYAWLIYNIAVLVTVVFLVHYLSWVGLIGFFAISEWKETEKKDGHNEN